ncbi:MAG: PAS domain S-box protein [Planctomycetes bacterium]|nr:PAS domain S-box protein [Planctomycetota bacterium]
MDKTAHSPRNEGIHRLWRERLGRLSMRDSPGPAMEGPHERSLVRRLTYLATLLGIIAALVGAGYLAAWLGGYMSQRGLSRITVKTNAALCLTLVGAALTLLVPTAVGQTRRWVARVCAAFAFLVGLLTFTENLWGWDFGIDQVLAIEVPGAIAVVNPNRMGMPASASFTLIGLALLIFSRRDRRGTRVAQSLALAVCLIGLLSTTGFLYGAREFYGIARYTGIAWPTAVALLLLGIGLLCARPAEGLMAQVTANDPGGVSIRRLLPPFVLLPLLLGWLRLVGERAGIFDAPTGTGLMMLLFIIIFSTLAYHTSHRASRAANALCESEDRFRTMANAIPQLAWIARADGYIYWYNQRWYDYTGTTPAQMEGWGWQSVHDPQQLPGVLERWKSSIATGQPFDMIFPLRGADGIFRPFLTRVMPLKDDQGRVQQWFGTNTDVSQQRKAQEERERLLHEVSVHAAQLQEANEQLAAVNEELATSNEELKATTEELQDEIKNRKEAEEGKAKLLATIQEQRDRLSALLRSITDEIWFADADKRLTLVNPAVLHEFGPNIGEGREVGKIAAGHEVYRPDGTVRPVEEAPPLRALRGEVVKDQEEIVRTPATGELRHRQVSAAPVRDAGGAIIGSVSVVRDITEQKKAEEALRASEERFRRYFELGLIGMAITSPTKGWIEVNDECCRLLGYERDELVQKTWAQLTYPDDLAADVAQFDRVLAGQVDGYTMDKRFVRKNGQIVDTTISVTAMRGADGAVDYFIALLQDITARKRAEEEIRQSQKTFAQLIERAPFGIYVVDSQFRIAVMNAGSQTGAFRNVRPVIGRDFAEAMRILWPEPVAAGIIAVFRHTLETGEPYYSPRFTNPRHDLETVESYEWELHRMTLPDGQYGIICYYYDSTKLRKAEEALREWNATLESKITQRTAELQHRAKQLQKLTLQLSQAEEQERRRIAMILHEDLQQQIAGAKFHLSLVRGRAREDRQRTDIDAVDGMLKEAIEKSRTLSRDLSPAVLHMNDLAELLQWLANRLRTQQGLSVNLDISGDLMLHSEALATFLFRAAQEMLFNVVKHAYVREAALRVRRMGRYVCLTVSDQGRGFDPQELKETPGLGLFSIRERTELLGGRLTVKSAEGEGSRLRLTVPDAQPAVAPPPSGVNLAQPGAAGLPSGGALRVLLVDDHDVVRAGLAALLRDTPGIELVGEAPDGREAINLANDLKPDVVIMDVSMPLMNGDQATRQIKMHLPQTRVIALSMYDEAEKKEKTFEAGAEDYILKTVSAEELLAAIRGKEPDA